MSNGERRKILCSQHDHLRETVSAARTVARSVLASTGSPRDLDAQVLALANELREHLADEERLLEPILERLDAWGPLRLALLRAEHAHQRAVLTVLTGGAEASTAMVIAGRTLTLCDDLMADMEFEERELINDIVLRDDVILLDASDA